jgi:hypothetical protein
VDGVTDAVAVLRRRLLRDLASLRPPHAQLGTAQGCSAAGIAYAPIMGICIGAGGGGAT